VSAKLEKNRVQRQTEEEEEEEMIQPKLEGERVRRQPEEEEEEIQPKRDGTAATGGPTRAMIGIGSAGAPLPPTTRAFFEPRFNADFSRVRVHADASAARSAKSIGASAYTKGADIAFASGRLAPDTASGRLLLAHELTHVIQQGAATRDRR
jgi:hypothetical protein